MKDGRYQILHVEDDKVRFQNYKRMVESALDKKGISYEIQWASTLEDACEQVMGIEKAWDLILLDISLNNNHGKNGLELVRMLRKNCVRDIPIFVVSANIGRYQDTLEEFKAQQMILGYGEPLDDDWPGQLYDILMGKQVSLLHLSDIHNGRFFAYDSLIMNQEAVLDDLCRKVGQVDFVVVSGDISSTNSEEDYRAAQKLLGSLGAKLSLKPHSFVFAPGNHDHDLDCEDSHTFSRYLTFLETFYDGDMQEESHYPSHELEDYDEVEQMHSELFSLVVYPKLCTLVVSFNSVNPLDLKVNREKTCPVMGGGAPCGLIYAGKITSQQIIKIDRELKNLYELHPEYKNFAKIATFHHNIFEPAHIEKLPWRPTLINQGNLLSLLSDHGFLLALHGHLHYKEVHYYKSSRNEHGLNIISTGTFSGKERMMDTDFCANKITYRISPQGQVTFFNLYQQILSRDSIQWRQQKILLGN